ncbi:uncharacterized protein STEHIDRAFT_166579 [Stereum hirsutum FP-91666 SS1]|uniref:uncharacterized protein n=1 Tax=Stereum hirsutum (strain FP-91666) TaxID=721885 RepID=UPI000440ED74|nr:uncharacterized protein STEHIDRAFT_166579 [Stereum hirsutum FP-91666 SS1]EIM90383.1 hypothetical protein STEHIDRAFT_166579 [Stereum hirsutum FP-91666 SS1]
MPAFDPVRDAVMNSPTQPSPGLPPPPFASPSFSIGRSSRQHQHHQQPQPEQEQQSPPAPVRRATDLSVLLNNPVPSMQSPFAHGSPAQAPNGPPRSLSHLLISDEHVTSPSSSYPHTPQSQSAPVQAPHRYPPSPDDKLARAPPLSRHSSTQPSQLSLPSQFQHAPPEPDHSHPTSPYQETTRSSAFSSPDALFTPVTERNPYFPQVPPSPYHNNNNSSAAASSRSPAVSNVTLSRPSTSGSISYHPPPSPSPGLPTTLAAMRPPPSPPTTRRPPSSSSSSTHTLPSRPTSSSAPPLPLPPQPSQPPQPQSQLIPRKPPTLPYAPIRKTEPTTVLIPLSADEARMYANYIGMGARRLAKRKRAEMEEAENQRAMGVVGIGMGMGKRGHENEGGGYGGYGGYGGPDGRDGLGEDGPRVKRSRDVGMVVTHYNARPEVGLVQRRESPIIGLRNFNNWIKSVLITKFAHPALVASPSGRGKVLDMGCGKGGDLAKWSKARVREYVGLDIAAISIDQARTRFESLHRRFDAFFSALDCYSSPLPAAVPSSRLSTPFDVVSMQFCMHYAFEDEGKARCMLGNVSGWLREGGVVVGTIPNAEQLLAQLDALPPNATDLSFGNAVYRIKFDDRNSRPTFGHRYSFFLQDAVEDVPEYIVHWDNFVSMAAEYDLHPIFKREFHEMFEDEHEHPEFGPLMERMKVRDRDGASQMDEDQWEAANIYIAFALEKRSTPSL